MTVIALQRSATRGGLVPCLVQFGAVSGADGWASDPSLRPCRYDPVGSHCRVGEWTLDIHTDPQWATKDWWRFCLGTDGWMIGLFMTLGLLLAYQSSTRVLFVHA